MKSLTLKQLREATEAVGTDPKFKSQPTGTNQALLRAIAYMLSQIDQEPSDPRKILVALGYERYRQALQRGNVQDEDLDTFAKNALDKAIARGRDGFASNDMWREHIPPQVDYYCDGVEVFKLEEGFDKLQEKLGLTIPIKHVNISDGNANSNYLDDTTINLVKEFYQDDYRTFGYEI